MPGSQNLTWDQLCLCLGILSLTSTAASCKQTGSSLFFFLSDIKFNLLLVHSPLAVSTPVYSVISSDSRVTDVVMQLWEDQIQSFQFLWWSLFSIFHLYIFELQNAKTQVWIMWWSFWTIHTYLTRKKSFEALCAVCNCSQYKK